MIITKEYLSQDELDGHIFRYCTYTMEYIDRDIWHFDLIENDTDLYDCLSAEGDIVFNYNRVDCLYKNDEFEL